MDAARQSKETSMARLEITGNTYPVRDALKALGGRWDADRKVWTVPAERADEARQLVATGAPSASGGRSSYRPSRCKRCGQQPDRRGWPRIYRSGICSDCYRDDRDDDKW